MYRGSASRDSFSAGSSIGGTGDVPAHCFQACTEMVNAALLIMLLIIQLWLRRGISPLQAPEEKARGITIATAHGKLHYSCCELAQLAGGSLNC